MSYEWQDGGGGGVGSDELGVMSDEWRVGSEKKCGCSNG